MTDDGLSELMRRGDELAVIAGSAAVHRELQNFAKVVQWKRRHEGHALSVIKHPYEMKFMLRCADCNSEDAVQYEGGVIG